MSFEIFESMADIVDANKSIKFRNCGTPNKKRGLASQESSNFSNSEKCGCTFGTNIIFTDSPMNIADCIINIGSWLREESISINVFICGLILIDKGCSVNRVLIKDVIRILKYLCLKHDFSFIDESYGSTLPNSNPGPSLLFKYPLHIIEEGSVKLAKLIINSIVLKNDTCFQSDSGNRYSYSDTWKNKFSISVALTLNETEFSPLSPLIHAHKCKHTPYSNNCDLNLFETHSSN